MFRRIILASILLVASLGIFQGVFALSASTGSVVPSSVSSFITQAKDISVTVISRARNVYVEIIVWYHKNNIRTTILPDILRVPIIDFFAVVSGIFLLFWLIFKSLSR